MAVTLPSTTVKNILVVEDNAFIRRLIGTLIEAHPDYRVSGEAADGVEAIAKAQELKPDLIVLDFSMPRMNGLETAKALHQAMPTIPTILLTFYKDVILDGWAESAGISAVLSKTDGMDALMEEIRRLV